VYGGTNLIATDIANRAAFCAICPLAGRDWLTFSINLSS
jgi:hypothetical protein